MTSGPAAVLALEDGYHIRTAAAQAGMACISTTPVQTRLGISNPGRVTP